MITIEGKDYAKLNLASGSTEHLKFPYPWLNVDVGKETADYICDVRALPKEWAEGFDEVRASHVFEHIYLDETKAVLGEWVRVLKPGGILRVIVPDLEIVLRYLLQGFDKKQRQAISGINPTPVMAQIFGLGYETAAIEDRWRHRMIYDRKSLIEVLARNEQLEDITIYPQCEDPAYEFGIKDDSQNQFTMCLRAIKKLKV